MTRIKGIIVALPFGKTAYSRHFKSYQRLSMARPPITDIRARQRAARNITIIRLSRRACPPSFWRGWTQEKIAEVWGLSGNRVSEIIGNTNFGNIDTLLSQGHDMDYIARHCHMDKDWNLLRYARG